jgi:hypothetical protein
VSHALQLFNDAFDATRPDKQNVRGQPAGKILGQAFAGQELLRKHGVFGSDETDAAVQFDRNASACMRNSQMETPKGVDQGRH